VLSIRETAATLINGCEIHLIASFLLPPLFISDWSLNTIFVQIWTGPGQEVVPWRLSSAFSWRVLDPAIPTWMNMPLIMGNESLVGITEFRFRILIVFGFFELVKEM
jgi:hypothetical protein